MKIKELRIGNYVQDAKGQIREVKGIDGYSSPFLWLKIPLCNLAIGRHSLVDIKPIPLSEELLLKCGFELFCSGLSDWVIDGYAWYIDFTDGIATIMSEDRHFDICKCQYLHQLQNLYFSLVGEELEVKF